MVRVKYSILMRKSSSPHSTVPGDTKVFETLWEIRTLTLARWAVGLLKALGLHLRFRIMVLEIFGETWSDYLQGSLTCSLGVIVFGLVTHKVVTWLLPAKNEAVWMQDSDEDGLLSDMVNRNRKLFFNLEYFQPLIYDFSVLVVLRIRILINLA